MKQKAIIFKYARVLCLYFFGFVAIVPACAQPVLFDFDNAPLHSGLPVTQTVTGITSQLTATGQGYSIQDANVLGFTPPGFSGRVIYPNSIFAADLLIKFDSTLSDFSIMYSCQELGCDDAATMRVTAYMNGIFIGTNTKTAGNPGTWPVDILSCSFLLGFDSVVVHYDSRPPTCQDYGVIFMADNMQVTTFTTVPVNLIYFNCQHKENTVVLQWKSASEINLSRYTVQYSSDGIHFQDLANLYAEGTDHNYSFIQHDVKGTAYYRLKMTDQDAAYKYSEIRKLVIKSNSDVTIIPNPSNDYIYINCDDKTVLNSIQIFSIPGILLKTVRDYTCGQQVNVSDLSKGAYILKVISPKNEVISEKLFLKL